MKMQAWILPEMAASRCFTAAMEGKIFLITSVIC